MYGPNKSLDNRITTYLKCNSNDALIPSHIRRLDKITYIFNSWTNKRKMKNGY